MRRPDVPVKLVIFDLDGTLVDAFTAISDSINFMLRRMGLSPRSHLEVKRSVGWGVDSLVSGFVAKEDVKEALAIFRGHHDRRLRRNIRLLPGVKTLLPFLRKQGCTLAIASNRPSKFCRIILEALDVDGYFDHMVCGDEVRRPKPHPDMLKVILRRSACRRQEALYVGDMTVDVVSARRAGIFSVAVPTGSCTLSELESERPGMLIHRISQVREFFPK
jgi:phosphoglycolate phosphatase